MKIIHLILGKANPERMNGVNKLVHEMASTQHKMGCKVELWGITPNPVHDYPRRNYKTFLFPKSDSKTKLDESLHHAVAQLDEDTVFHFHGGFIPEFYLMSGLLRKHNVEYCYTPHGALAPAAMKRRAWKKKIYFRFFEKKLIKQAKAVICTGQSVYDNLDRLTRVDRKVLIHNGQPAIPNVKANERQRNKLIFGFCGRIAMEHKGLDLLLQGFKLFLEKGGVAELHIIGDGEEMPKLLALAEELELLGSLKSYGARFGEEKFSILKTFDCFVHTSRMEGFPASVLEACAAGVPCLVSKATNVGHYINEYKAGWVLPVNNPTGIAGQMMDVEMAYRDKALRKLGQNARTLIRNRFDWKNICEQLMEEYHRSTPIEIAKAG